MFLTDPTPLESLWEGVTTVISNVMTSLGTVGTSLIANPIFQIMFGILILGVVIGLVFRLVRKVKTRG